jgi:hypothetical protein
MSWGGVLGEFFHINTLNYPGFLGRVREFPCREVRFPSWKYNIGRIFKITWWCDVTLQRHGYGESANTTLAVASSEGGGQGWGGRILVNYVNRPKKNY